LCLGRAVEKSDYMLGHPVYPALLIVPSERMFTIVTT